MRAVAAPATGEGAMGWRWIPLCAALSVFGVGRIVHDSMIATASAGVATDVADDVAMDLARVDFSSWIKPTTQPTTEPTAQPLEDRTAKEVATIDQAPVGSAKDLMVVLQTISIGKFQTPTPFAGYVAKSPDVFDRPAIDIASSSFASQPADMIGSTAGSSSSSADRTTKPIADVSGDVLPPPLTASIGESGGPAESITGFNFPGNSPLPAPVIALPPPSVPEPGMVLMPVFVLWMGRRRVCRPMNYQTDQQ